MIIEDRSDAPDSPIFDLAIVALGYERRCRYVMSTANCTARAGVALEFGFSKDGSYNENCAFFEGLGYLRLNGLERGEAHKLSTAFVNALDGIAEPSILVDISSMSREMIASAALALASALGSRKARVSAAYAPSRFESLGHAAPIRVARPIRPELAGWSTRPEQPLAAIFGLGCDEGLALGALQVLEPDKAWLYVPRGLDERFYKAVQRANGHIDQIFDVTRFEYDIADPVVSRAKYEALLNSVSTDYRIVTVPFGPKIFAWMILATIVFSGRRDVGVWTFSSRDHAPLVDREAEGTIIWHRIRLQAVEA